MRALAVGLLSVSCAAHDAPSAAPLQVVQRLRGGFGPLLSLSSSGAATATGSTLRVCAPPTMQQQRHRHKMQQQRAASNQARSKGFAASRRPRNSNKHNEPNYSFDDVPNNHWLNTLPTLGLAGQSTPTRTSAQRQRRMRASGRALDSEVDADSDLCSKPAPGIEVAAKVAAAAKKALEPLPQPEVAPPVRTAATARKTNASGASKGRLPKQRKAPPLSDALKAQLERELEVEATLRAKINRRLGLEQPELSDDLFA